MHRWSRYWLCLGLAALLAIGGCSAKTEEASPYPILDSGVPASTIDKLYWLDNDRVIFVSFGSKPKSTEEKWGPPSIYIWDTRTNKVSEFKHSAEELCFNEGYIVYAVVKRPYDPADPAKWYAGPMGQEQEFSPPSVFVDNVVRNPYTCRWVERPAYTKGHGVIPLRDGDGWLVSSKPSRVNEPAEWLLYRPDGSTVNTGIPTNLHLVMWVEYARQYFVGGFTNGLSGEDCLRYWWITPAGAVEKGCQDIRPIKRWNKGLMAAVPSPLGVLISGGKSGDFDRGTAGFYRTDGGESTRVDVGTTWSPDGCKSAFIDVPGLEGARVGGRGDARLKMTNICGTNK